MSEVLESHVQYLKGVGPKLAKVLAQKGIETFEDALYFLPRDYEDRRVITPIRSLRPGTSAVVLGTVASLRPIRMGRKQRLEVHLQDPTGEMLLTWFHAYPSLLTEFAVGKRFLVYGDVRRVQGLPSIAHPDYEPVDELKEGKPTASMNFGRIIPIYSETEGLKQKTLRRLIGQILQQSIPHIKESLPDDLRSRMGLPSLRQSITHLHYPTDRPSLESRSNSLERLIFEEFFVLQLGLALKKQNMHKAKAPVFKSTNGVEKFFGSLPFQLTEDQKKAFAIIQKDLQSGMAMTRLVQGDVGSGKTVVGLAAAVLAIEAGYQVAFMAPTEVLAQQHYRTAEKLLEKMGIEVALLTHQQSGKQPLLEKLASGSAKLVVGTHALFQQDVQFKKLGLVIVDEQHRFGVEQRAELMRKASGSHAHLLMMTATPIPRTLALTLYGDLDVTLIREKPAGRKPIQTSIIPEKSRARVYEKIRERVGRSEQVYIIYPLVEASEKLDLKSATEMFERLRTEVFPDLKIALVHGRMKSEEKDEVISDFKKGKYQILVSTTVIEVGIDVPQATLMVIEHPERLGLSQLHQLRGRVGRGSAKSECLLVCGSFATERLRIMERTEDGFVIAEEDLRIRGPGEFLGTRQSGLPGFRVGDVVRDVDLLSKAREEAERILQDDPQLEKKENALIREMVEHQWKGKIERLTSG